MNRRLLAALLGSGVLATGLAVMLILGHGGERAREPRTVPPERGAVQMVRGRVLDGLGLPLRDCQVVLEALRAPGVQRAWERHARTGDGGTFALPAPSTIPLVLTVRPEQAAPWVAATGFRLPPAQDLDLGDVAVPARSGIAVQVTRAEDGAGLPGAIVRLAPVSEPGGLPGAAAAALQRQARTADTGRAVLYEVPPGTYRITAEARGRAPGEILVRHPAGNPAAEPLALPLALTLRGRVEGPGGAPVPGVRVTVQPTQDGPEHGARGGPLGGFVVEGLLPGRHRLELEVPESGTWIRDLVLPRGEVPVLRLPEGGRLAGRILGPERSPLPGARVRAATEDGAPLARDGWLWQPGAVAGEDGSFRISGLPPGRFRLHASSEGLAPKEAGPLETDGTEVTLLLEGPGILSGKVLDYAGLPLQNAVIELLPPTQDGPAFTAFQRSLAGSGTESTHSGRGGAFRLAAPPGEAFLLRITAREQAPLVLGPFRVDAGATRDLGVLKMPRAAWIRGRVLDVRGKPAAGAMVHADPLPLPSGVPGPPAAAATSDREGRFSLGPLAPGAYEVSCRFPGREPASFAGEETASRGARPPARRQVRVEAGEQHVLEIRSR